MNTKRAFTLIELLVVIAITSILGAVLLPTLTAPSTSPSTPCSIEACEADKTFGGATPMIRLVPGGNPLAIIAIG